MKVTEDYQESCEFHIQPDLRPFVARIYQSEDIYQDAFCYIGWHDKDSADVYIKMPIYVNPEAIRDNVSDCLWSEHGLMLGSLDFKLAPKTFAP